MPDVPDVPEAAEAVDVDEGSSSDDDDDESDEDRSSGPLVSAIAKRGDGGGRAGCSLGGTLPSSSSCIRRWYCLLGVNIPKLSGSSFMADAACCRSESVRISDEGNERSLSRM